VFDAGHAHVRDASFAFYKCGLGLYPEQGDVIALIEEYDRRRGDGVADLDLLEELVLLAPRHTGVHAAVRAAAARVGAGSSAFLAKLAALAKPIVHDWERKQKAAEKRADARRARVHQSFRDRLTKELTAVDAGPPACCTIRLRHILAASETSTGKRHPTRGCAIGGDPSRDATALEHLILVADPSYVDPLRMPWRSNCVLGAIRSSHQCRLRVSPLSSAEDCHRPSTICGRFLATALKHSTTGCIRQQPICGKPIGTAPNPAAKISAATAWSSISPASCPK
jgi:hypothetical protein